ncbi:MAG TPA: NAD(P)-dependent oxidoreductase [Polyangiaceae bacterium]|nr:NAD(P)-dependent oxidoreductase [Polyangiaceae bacterium]
MSAAERIAFLGLGAMGRRMAGRLVDAGHDVVVWSRSGVPDDAPRLRGREAPSPRAAAEGAGVVVSMVADDEASKAVWDDPRAGALAALGAGALAIESSTLTPARVAELGGRVRSAGAQFLDAPVVGSRPQADAGALVYLVGGEPDAVDRARPLLAALGRAVHHVGPTPAGSLAKLVANALFGVQIAAVAELLGFAARARLDAAGLLEALGDLPVLSPAAKLAAGGMLAGRFEPMFPAALAEKDFRYALAAAEAVGGRLPVTGRVREIFEHAVARGLGGENLTAVAKLYE